ncbi:DUF58 domain-containing protein [Leucobacter sp. wl10]|uniref:DUF58 domain-containing protein n=1 Tax=Leucobacter sp. wl10 TaxID=2304677 RepID=UPI000E5B7F9F|nr:DUF58 domain-containing protein [Leucobacter sp. wl10]RGE21424.1 DUF58 domain-containing protein [Leucobacter sp. wl10]
MRVALTRRGRGFALTAVGLGAGWFVIGLRDLWFLAALPAAMAVLAVLLAFVLSRAARFEVRLSASDATPTVGDEVRFTASAVHRLPRALPVRVIWEVEGERLELPLVAEGSRAAACRAGWTVRRRGHLRVRVAGLVVPDPLGLATVAVRVDAGKELLVLPALIGPLADRLEDPRLGVDSDDGSGSPAAARDSGTPGGAVRAYRSGDALRQVRWKQSARQGDLLVNLYDTAESADESLLLITAEDAFSDDAEFELAVSAAATLAAHWMRSGRSVRLHLGDDAPRLCRNEHELLRVLAEVRTTAGSSAPSTEILLAGVEAVVAGTVSRRLVEELLRYGGGLLLAVQRSPEVEIPSGWHRIAIPSPGPGTGASRAEAGARVRG